MTKRSYRRRPSTNERTQAAVDRFSAAVQGQTDDLHDATGALLETLANAAQQQATQVAALLMERLERIERRQELLQRHIEAIDVRLNELGRERAIGE